MNTDTLKADVSIGDNPTLVGTLGGSGVPPLRSRPGSRFVAGDVILGRYTVLRELGEGGMGVVYQCLDSVGGVEVAMKCLPPEVSRSVEEMEDIRANYQLVRSLRHPNIAGVATLEQDKATGDYYLVMDLAQGVTLKSWMRRNAAAPRETKLAILRQVAAALDYAHAEKVLHRDVKPENVMVDAEGRVKVLDFGLAAQIRSSQSRTSNAVTSKGGTPGYKSPEQWLGRPQRAAADVYSFGVLAYWMLAGHLPFDGDDPVVLGHAVISAPVEPVEGLPESMNAALAKALAKKPEERFPSCGSFVDALGGAQLVAPATGGSQLATPANHANTGGAQLVAPETGGSRSRATAPLLIAAALALAVLGGWWLFVPTGTTGVLPVDKMSEARERRAELRKEGKEFTINEPYGMYMTMKWCPPGTFTMGSPVSEGGRYDDETQHEVRLTKGFWLGETEVTQGQWKKIMDGETVLDLARKALQDDTLYQLGGKKQTLREFWGKERNADPRGQCGDLKDDVPVYYVSWSEAEEFCRRLTQKERAAGRIPDDYEYRLPTEAEWEYACRAGTTAALPNGGNILILGEYNAPALDDIAWYGGNSSVGFSGVGWETDDCPEKQYPGGRAAPREVKDKLANNWGLYDMIGNMWEWCEDWYGAYQYGPATDPAGPVQGAYRVIRGGSWRDGARYCRSARRGGAGPGFRFNFMGFRVALAPSH